MEHSSNADRDAQCPRSETLFVKPTDWLLPHDAHPTSQPPKPLTGTEDPASSENPSRRLPTVRILWTGARLERLLGARSRLTRFYHVLERCTIVEKESVRDQTRLDENTVIARRPWVFSSPCNPWLVWRDSEWTLPEDPPVAWDDRRGYKLLEILDTRTGCLARPPVATVIEGGSRALIHAIHQILGEPTWSFTDVNGDDKLIDVRHRISTPPSLLEPPIDLPPPRQPSQPPAILPLPEVSTTRDRPWTPRQCRALLRQLTTDVLRHYVPFPWYDQQLPCDDAYDVQETTEERRIDSRTRIIAHQVSVRQCGGGVSKPATTTRTYSRLRKTDEEGEEEVTEGVDIVHTSERGTLRASLGDDHRLSLRTESDKRSHQDRTWYLYKAAQCRRPAAPMGNDNSKRGAPPNHDESEDPTWQPCVVKLAIHPSARAAIPRGETKIRVDRARVVAIVPFTTKRVMHKDSPALFDSMEAPDLGHFVPRTSSELCSASERLAALLDMAQAGRPEKGATLDPRVLRDIIPAWYTQVFYQLDAIVDGATSCVYAGGSLDYRLGEVVEVPEFDDSMDRPCAPGIHGHLVQEQALYWHGISHISPDLINGYDALESIVSPDVEEGKTRDDRSEGCSKRATWHDARHENHD